MQYKQGFVSKKIYTDPRLMNIKTNKQKKSEFDFKTNERLL